MVASDTGVNGISLSNTAPPHLALSNTTAPYMGDVFDNEMPLLHQQDLRLLTI